MDKNKKQKKNSYENKHKQESCDRLFNRCSENNNRDTEESKRQRRVSILFWLTIPNFLKKILKIFDNNVEASLNKLLQYEKSIYCKKTKEEIKLLKYYKLINQQNKIKMFKFLYQIGYKYYLSTYSYSKIFDKKIFYDKYSDKKLPSLFIQKNLKQKIALFRTANKLVQLYRSAQINFFLKKINLISIKSLYLTNFDYKRLNFKPFYKI